MKSYTNQSRVSGLIGLGIGQDAITDDGGNRPPARGKSKSACCRIPATSSMAVHALTQSYTSMLLKRSSHRVGGCEKRILKVSNSLLAKYDMELYFLPIPPLQGWRDARPGAQTPLTPVPTCDGAGSECTNSADRMNMAVGIRVGISASIELNSN